jgi:hypothetical protein
LLGQRPSPVAAVICDYGLGGPETGIEVLRRLTARSFGSPIGVLITGDTNAEVLRLAGAAGYRTLHKPVRPARLRSLLSHLLVPSLEVSSGDG